jgi:2-hydroxy-6-oxonona-2,4-dienedioate hydrolase
MRKEDGKFIDAGGIRTHYYEKGDGPPLVLFHGGAFGHPTAADSAWDWSTNFDDLAKRYRVIAVDKLGQGFTDNPKSDADYCMAAVVEHAADLLHALGVGPADLVGHSRGGYLTCRLTLDHPELVRSCTIVDSNTSSPGVELNGIVLGNPPEPRLSRESHKWIFEHYSYSPNHITPDWLDICCEIATLPKYLEAWHKMETEGLRVKQFAPGLAADKSKVFAMLRDEGLKRPTQIIWGKNDPTASIEQGWVLWDLIAKHRSDAQFHIINQAGHFSYREHPKQFNELIHAFVGGSGVG